MLLPLPGPHTRDVSLRVGFKQHTYGWHRGLAKNIPVQDLETEEHFKTHSVPHEATWDLLSWIMGTDLDSILTLKLSDHWGPRPEATGTQLHAMNKVANTPYEMEFTIISKCLICKAYRITLFTIQRKAERNKFKLKTTTTKEKNKSAYMTSLYSSMILTI